MKKQVVSIDRRRERATEALQKANGWCLVTVEDQGDEQEISWWLDSDEKVSKTALLGSVFACLARSAATDD